MRIRWNASASQGRSWDVRGASSRKRLKEVEIPSGEKSDTTHTEEFGSVSSWDIVEELQAEY